MPADSSVAWHEPPIAGTAAAAERDRVWLLVLAVTFVFGLAVSWDRWGNPLIDTGREMNHPLRLAGGEMLYSDVRHVYGPLSPFVHSALFRAFGPSLAMLYIDGIITAAVILGLVYWLARQIMGPVAAGTTTLSVMWLCAFKPAGNYILPYSYNALHGAALGLITLAIVVRALACPPKREARRRDSSLTGSFLIAGCAAGLTILAKTEMGLAALAGGVTAAVLAAGRDRGLMVKLASAFVLAALCLAGAGYAAIAARVGWSTLADDNWLFFYNVPPELAHYNRWVSGLDNPVTSLRRILIATVKLGIVAAIVAAASRIIAGDRAQWRLLGGAFIAIVLLWLTLGLDVNRGPYLAMPLLLIGLLVFLIRRGRAAPETMTTHAAIVITCSVYALASLARMILRVRSGGAYASYLLPVSVVMFTYLWVGPFADRFRDGRAARAARAIALVLIAANAVGTAAILAYRYQTRATTRIATVRGTMIAEPDVGQAWNEALEYIQAHTRPDDSVAVMPEGSSLNFLSGRRNPLRDDIVIPGILDENGESDAIRRLQDARTPLILIANRPTAEFGRPIFGRDYLQRLMGWIDANYATCAMFGPVKDRRLQIGDGPFFIRAYCRERK